MPDVPHMSADEFRRHGREVIDWIADYLERRVDDLPVQSRAKPGDVRAQLPDHAPARGEPFADMLRDVERVILPGVTHWQSPNFFAYFPSNTSYPAILGELLGAGFGVQGMLWATSPACTELETHVLDWLVDMLGLPVEFKSGSTGGGVIQDTASSATLCAMIAARERATNLASNRAGVRQPLVAYCSNQAHSSVEKAAKVCGIGSENLRKVDVDADFRMNVDHLRALMARDRADGLKPFFVCATVGTTSSGAVDPVRAIGGVIREDALTPGLSPDGRGQEIDRAPMPWLHVDAAWAGAAALCPEFRFIHDGLDHADSYCFNPHKWMLTNFDCDCFWVRDRASLINALSILPEYLRNQATESGAVFDYRDWQIPLGRRFRALKLWFVIRHYGVEGLHAHVRHHVSLAQWFEEQVRAHPAFELAAPRSLSLVCFRHRGGDAINQRTLDAVNASGEAYFSHTKLNGKLTLRHAIGAWKTRQEYVERVWALIVRTSDES
jgi:aromatic-L-amino-acid decarboxylase